MKLGAAQLSLPNASLNDLSSLLFVQGSPYTHWRNHMTHVLWKVGSNPLAWGIFVSCPNIRVWFCGWSAKIVRGGPSLSYCRMIGRIIVVQIGWTQIVSSFFAFFPVGVTWLLLFSNLFGEVVGGVACFFRVSCQTLRFYCMVQGLKCSVAHVPNDDPLRFRFFWRRVFASGVEFPCPSSEGDSWGVVWRPTYGTEIRVWSS